MTLWQLRCFVTAVDWGNRSTVVAQMDAGRIRAHAGRPGWDEEGIVGRLRDDARKDVA